MTEVRERDVVKPRFSIQHPAAGKSCSSNCTDWGSDNDVLQWRLCCLPGGYMVPGLWGRSLLSNPGDGAVALVLELLCLLFFFNSIETARHLHCRS